MQNFPMRNYVHRRRSSCMIKLTISLLVLLFTFSTHSKNYFIYSIDHKIPTGERGTSQLPQKNFYLNIGTLQGVEEGTVLEVRRKISKNNKFQNNKEFTFHIKVGLLKVIQANENSSIAIVENSRSKKNEPFTEYQAVMLGDEVTIPID